ncbi:MAG: peptide deformylase [Firmicutes bacterium]|nr:peptide deformylase [Bacillota bacterium]
MKTLKVIQDPNPILRKRALPVSLPLSEEDSNLLKGLLKYVHQSQDKTYAEKHQIREGIGLAAPQVGISKRLTAISYQRGEIKTEYMLANPIIVSQSVKQIALTSGEGCLSVPSEHPGYVYRANKITVKAFDLIQNKEILIHAEGFDAIVLQHEIDHLNGILFYDYLDKKDPFKEKSNSILL